MPARQVCQNFFRNALVAFHKYRQNALLDATIALINGASLTLISIGCYLPGTAQVKNKIKRVGCLPGNEYLHSDIPLIFRNIISMLTSQLSLCVIVVDWSGYRIQELKASNKPEYLGPGTFVCAEPSRCDGYFYLHKKAPKWRKNKCSRCGITRPTQVKDARSGATEPWLKRL